ncbi:MAG TPA: hypothetical protein VLY21_05590 [Nitrososphaerales archaeon]|nr:hypothetical protein [Nitrososphaerales archaeon]
MAKIRVKVGTAEVEVEAEMERMKEAIGLIPDVLEKLPAPEAPSAAALVQPLARAASDLEPRSRSEDLPAVSLDKSDSLADVIGKFFSDPWGRDRRKLSDVRDALQSYGLNYPKQSVAVALLRLAKATKIRRFKAEDGEYVYTASAPFVVIQAPQPSEGALRSG